ncbi:HVO_A0556 family zinc finger protein [Natrinema sp. LN54]|uniref:HVO_A0556 family zinc finger protein n=1 Tax=Natrinema sp. LN54 TaxID=3458705 RepID=UPI004035130C
MQLTDDAATGRSVLDALEGDACSYCEDGTLVRDRYHGNAAVVCDDCHTPGAQVW